MVSLVKALTEEREVEPGQGVRVRLKPVGFARFARLNAEALIRAQRELSDLAREGEHEGEAEPSGMAIAQLSQVYLDRRLVLESIVGWEGVDDGEGNVAPVTEETWTLFAELYPDLATVVIAEIRQPGILAAAEGNAYAPSPNGTAAGARNTAGTAGSSPGTPASPAPDTAAAAPARRTTTDRAPKRPATSPKP